ncbi:VPS10 domain-containing protein [Fimbriimonas ginsengisoli]|uniref:Glycosyl hydrolase, BNR repeat n=1 Tax=Fimbriimonas ginsengisoli Gsoil 348 TaxID=661478 RepID=A0A068NPN7_FIMGI|nr:hypothetical protein [Fimbriimonas ginsengisoli]AIE84715.1 Glycosyl hydrolase, BNR repeat precursor [Fimbriimonas ginsengisoli Gsoil 348]
MVALPVLLSLLAHSGDPKPRVLSADDLKALSWRSVGPANMGGRVSDVCFAPGNAKTFFVAFGCSGLWKTTNRGTTFSPVFDHESTSSIGSVVVADAPANWRGWADDKEVKADQRAEKGRGKIVWVGTGEGNGRNSSSWGDGVYRSTDGGASWKKTGLEDSRDIPRLAVDPRDPDTCYAAALGHLWGPNKTRGIYKTTDGGKTWNPSLQIDENTGAIDVAIDPKDPDTVYAAMYQRRRTAWSFQSGGAEGGIYRTRDGGKKWEKLSKGLPGQSGRIGLAISPSNPKVLMAAVESDEGGGRNIDDNRSRRGGIFRSENGGDTWTRVNAQIPRAFYFAKVRIDPKNDQRVYLLGWDIWRSEDGGRTFLAGQTDKLHVDWHAMTIDPEDPDHLVVGSDGGLYQSNDRGATWDFLNTMAVGQFYNIAVDMSDPYRISGGLQDNGSWMGPSSSLIETGGTPNTGITNGDWKVIGGGDGFHVGFDPTDPNIVYSESQGAFVGRINLATGEYRTIRPDVKEGQSGLRFNWNSPFFVSPHDPKVLYLGGNHVFKLTNKGEDFAKISPDLTTRDPNKMDTTGSNAETYCTVVSLAESPVQKGLLWAGTDDGLIQVTSDDGAHWQNVTPKAVSGRYIAKIEPSHRDRQAAYVAVDGHRSDDYDPCVLMTLDGGKSWKEITGDLPKGASVRVVREDLHNSSVLYAGTETGIYMTADRGQHWIRLDTGSLPTVGVHDIVQHPRDMDLIVATHGRSIWILDDAAALGELTSATVAKDLHLFPILATRPRLRGGLDGMWGDRFFGAANPPLGAKITYWVRDKQDGSASIKIEDAKGETIATLTGPANSGLNRAIWDLQPEAKRRLQNHGEDPGTVWVPSGTYKVTVTVGGKSESTNLVVPPYHLGSDVPLPPVSRGKRDDD